MGSQRLCRPSALAGERPEGAIEHDGLQFLRARVGVHRIAFGVEDLGAVRGDEVVVGANRGSLDLDVPGLGEVFEAVDVVVSVQLGDPVAAVAAEGGAGLDLCGVLARVTERSPTAGRCTRWAEPTLPRRCRDGDFAFVGWARPTSACARVLSLDRVRCVRAFPAVHAGILTAVGRAER